MIWSSSTALVVGLIAQVIMVPRYGALGAVLSRCTSETIVTVILGLAVVRMLMQDLRERVRGPVLSST
jgi:O-antigen/teichoic acid export membrane protein